MANAGETFNVSGPIGDGSNGFGVTKTGAGVLLLTSGNTYTGATTITQGTLVLGSSGSIVPSSAVSSTASGATFDISGTGGQVTGVSQRLDSLSGVSGSIVDLGGQTLTLSIGSGSQTVNSTINDGGLGGGTGGVLAKQGNGTLTLTAANTYTGGTRLRSGTITVGNDSALGSGTLTMTTGTTLGFSTAGLSIQNAIAFAGGDPTVDTSGGSETLGGVISGPGRSRSWAATRLR